MSLSRSSINSQQNLTGAKPYKNETYEFEAFRLDAAHLMLYHGERTISLKPKVVETLVALVERRGEVVGKDELMDRLWADSFVEEANLTQNIYLLRKTLGQTIDGRPFIETFSRRGYRFNGEIKDPEAAELLIATRTRTQTVTEEETIEGLSDRARNRLVIGAIAICGLVIISGLTFVGFGNYGTAAVAPFENFRFKRHTDRGDVTSAAISPDGKFIAYFDKSKDLWLKNAATGSNVKVQAESGGTTSHVAAISPDNNYIYLVSGSDGGKNELLKMSLFGGGVRQRISENLWAGVSLSPDGKQVSFVRGTDTGETLLMVANTDGSGERSVVVSSANEWFGLWSQSTAWSPDSSRIVCTGTGSPDGKQTLNIKIFRAADGAELSLIQPDLNWRWISAVAWMPDGDNFLLISGDQSSQGQIYKYTLSTGEWRRVTNDLSNYVAMSVTADGNSVITIQDENPGNLWVLPADGGSDQARQITFGRNLLTDTTGLSWTPAGKIVYATNTSGRWEIWMIDANGDNQKQLTQDCAGNDNCSQPVVSPDGRYIVFQAARDRTKNIWRMDTDGRNPTQLTEEGGSYPSITPDGRFVVYSTQVSPIMLWQVPIDGGKAEQFSPISQALAAAVSPDGRLFAFGHYDKTAKQPFQTCIAPVEAAEPQKCYSNSRSFPRWTDDSKGFYYLDHGYAGIWKQQLDAERKLFLEFPGERTNNFAFSPDRSQLVVARSKPTQDIVALINGK